MICVYVCTYIHKYPSKPGNQESLEYTCGLYIYIDIHITSTISYDVDFGISQLMGETNENHYTIKLTNNIACLTIYIYIYVLYI